MMRVSNVSRDTTTNTHEGIAMAKYLRANDAAKRTWVEGNRARDIKADLMMGRMCEPRYTSTYLGQETLPLWDTDDPDGWVYFYEVIDGEPVYVDYEVAENRLNAGLDMAIAQKARHGHTMLDIEQIDRLLDGFGPDLDQM